MFTWLLHAGGTVIALIVGVPALLSAVAPGLSRRRRNEWRALGPLGDVPVGQTRAATVDPSVGGWPPALRPTSVYIWRRGAAPEDLVVFSRSCTDLGCPVTYDPGSACFFCPCHGGIFAQDGARMAGPPDRALDRYTTRVRDGIIEIDVGSVPPVAS